jgi:hypothetical protein
MESVHADADATLKANRRNTRCPPVPLRIIYALPKGTDRLYFAAAAEGRSMNPRRGFDDLWPKERPIGVRVSQVHRDRVLRCTRSELRAWQRAFHKWVAAGLAHSCARGRLFLLIDPPRNGRCPDCNATLPDVSTRHGMTSYTSWDDASDARNGEPSTGTQEGEGRDGSRVPVNATAWAMTDDDVRASGYEPTPRGWKPREVTT